MMKIIGSMKRCYHGTNHTVLKVALIVLISMNFQAAAESENKLFGLALGQSLSGKVKILSQISDDGPGGVKLLVKPPIPNSGFVHYEAIISKKSKVVASVKAENRVLTYKDCIAKSESYSEVISGKRGHLQKEQLAAGNYSFNDNNGFSIETRCEFAGNKVVIEANLRSAWQVVSSEGKKYNVDSSGL